MNRYVAEATNSGADVIFQRRLQQVGTLSAFRPFILAMPSLREWKTMASRSFSKSY